MFGDTIIQQARERGQFPEGLIATADNCIYLAFDLRDDHLKVNRCPLAYALQSADGTRSLTRYARRAEAIVDGVAVRVQVAYSPLTIRSVPVATWRVVAIVVTSKKASFICNKIYLKLYTSSFL